MPFVKLDCGILHSSLWIDHDARTVFVTALLMARPYVLEQSADALAIRKIDPLGFTVAPGEYGFVAAASTGIITAAGLSQERGKDALERLCDVDADSRTPDHEGRRMVRVAGGYLILNYAKYREQDRTNAERQARHRQKKRASPIDELAAPGSNGSNGVTSVTNNASRSRSRVLANANISEGSKLPSSPDAASPAVGARESGKKIGGAALLELFHATCPTLPKVQKLTPERKKHVAARARACEGDPLEWFRRLFEKAAASDFLAGKDGSFRASFDWLLSPTNAQKTLEGNYDNENRKQQKTARQNARTDATTTTEPDADKFAGWGQS